MKNGTGVNPEIHCVGTHLSLSLSLSLNTVFSPVMTCRQSHVQANFTLAAEAQSGFKYLEAAEGFEGSVMCLKSVCCV